MQRLLLLFLGIICINLSHCVAQSTTGIWVIDLVKITPGKEKEAIYFYTNNWQVFREAAKKEGYISSYQMIRTHKQDVAQFDLLLMTEFADSASFNNMEENFRRIISARQGGPRFLNELRPKDFMELVNSVEGVSLLTKD